MEALSIELLEHILSDLPILDLLLSQRVCRTWRTLITNSPALQQSLFLRPSPGPFKAWKRTWTASTDSTPSIYTLEAVQVPGITTGLIQYKGDTDPPRPVKNDYGKARDSATIFFEDGEIDTHIRYAEGKRPAVSYAEKSQVCGTLNPFFFLSLDQVSPDREPDATVTDFLREASKAAVNLPDWKDDSWGRLQRTLLNSHPTASWRKMYISQPPVTSLYVHQRDYLKEDMGLPEDRRFGRSSFAWPQRGQAVLEAIMMGDMIGEFDAEYETCKYDFVFSLEGVIFPPLSELSLEEIASVPLDKWDGERRYLGKDEDDPEYTMWDINNWPFG